MSSQYHVNPAAKWLSGQESFLKNRVKQRILRSSVENLTVPLPLDLPVQHCSDDFYAEHLAGALVVLCCDTPAGEAACVALGIFVGDKLWANTLDPALRFRGRRENFDPSAGLVADANHLLAPVHIVTSLLRRDIAHLGPASSFGEPRLPGQLQLAVPDLQAALAAEPLPPDSPHHAQQQLAHAVHAALDAVKGLRSDDTADADRQRLVATVLGAMSGAVQEAQELPPTKRRNLASTRKAKAAQETKRLLEQGARNTRSSMALAYSDYDSHLPLLHALSGQL